MLFNAKCSVRLLFLLMVLLLCACRHASPAAAAGGVAAKDALATFQVADGFKIEMIASEPLITSPVDMEIDEYGRMYVVQMPGYPLDKSGSGKIILLSDTNGDGTMDKSVVFKGGLVLPTSVMRWKKGIIVTDSPNLLYLEDTNGDGQADVMDTLLTGFALTNPQHNLNNPIYGLDNWIYLAHQGAVSTREYKKEFGDQGSEIVFYGDKNSPKLPKNAGGRSVRLRPDTRQLEMVSSNSQFGHTFDAWGHLFGCNNSNQGYQEVIANRYFQRNPNLLIPDATNNMSDHQDAAEVFPTTVHPDRQLLTDVGVMTSACGLTAYLGDAFPEPYRGNITFVAEPVSNLVHVDVLHDSGVSFVASRILQNKEFLSSTDAWSRPVNMYVGPDGALYVLDYYRRVIESPEWMSEEAIKAGGLYDGADRGRIFRITPVNAKGAQWTQGLKLGDASNEELVSTLANPNLWWRMNAQRLLVDRGGDKAVTLLEKMTTNRSPMARLHALWTLEGLGQLRPDYIVHALADSVAGIRENAVKIAELHLKTSPQFGKELLQLQNDADAKVRFQLLLTLGFVNTPAAAQARSKLLFSGIGDNWMQIAALSAGSSQTSALLDLVLHKFRPDVPAFATLVQRLTNMVGVGGTPDEIRKLVTTSLSATGREPAKEAAILQGLAQGLQSREAAIDLSAKDQQSLVKDFFTDPAFAKREASLTLLRVNGISDSSVKNASMRKAAVIMQDASRDKRERQQAIRFLALGDAYPYAEVLKKLIAPAEETTIQLEALQTLGGIKGTAISEYLVTHWPVITPELREPAIATFMDDSSRISVLIDALEKDKIKPGSIDFSTSVQLMENSNAELRNRARSLFTKNERERVTVNKEYEKALDLNGDAGNGKRVFVQNCAICHQVRGKIGVAFGPDLGTIHNWIKEDIMANVINPNLSISSGYDLWQVVLNDGESIKGIIASETPTAITLRNNGQTDRAVNRQDIRSLKAMNASAMPMGLEKKINQQQMADLLAFLRQG